LHVGGGLSCAPAAIKTTAALVINKTLLIIMRRV
jgi:hypothetical protein